MEGLWKKWGGRNGREEAGGGRGVNGVSRGEEICHLRRQMPQTPNELPLGLLIPIMVLGVVLVLVAVSPTAWVDRVHKMIRKRRGGQ